MVELLGLGLILFGGLWIFNPANPLPNEKENLKIIKKRLQGEGGATYLNLWGKEKVEK